jgi:hypothetical protein
LGSTDARQDFGERLFHELGEVQFCSSLG